MKYTIIFIIEVMNYRKFIDRQLSELPIFFIMVKKSVILTQILCAIIYLENLSIFVKEGV